MIAVAHSAHCTRIFGIFRKREIYCVIIRFRHWICPMFTVHFILGFIFDSMSPEQYSFRFFVVGDMIKTFVDKYNHRLYFMLSQKLILSINTQAKRNHFFTQCSIKPNVGTTLFRYTFSFAHQANNHFKLHVNIIIAIESILFSPWMMMINKLNNDFTDSTFIKAIFGLCSSAITLICLTSKDLQLKMDNRISRLSKFALYY